MQYHQNELPGFFNLTDIYVAKEAKKSEKNPDSLCSVYWGWPDDGTFSL